MATTRTSVPVNSGHHSEVHRLGLAIGRPELLRGLVAIDSEW
jgi:hypothetical protein